MHKRTNAETRKRLESCAPCALPVLGTRPAAAFLSAAALAFAATPCAMLRPSCSRASAAYTHNCRLFTNEFRNLKAVQLHERIDACAMLCGYTVPRVR